MPQWITSLPGMWNEYWRRSTAEPTGWTPPGPGVTFLSTLAGGIMCALGPGTVIGLPWIFQYVTDTGPSAAVVALAVQLCCVRRAPRTLALVLTAMLTEVTLLPNLAGREHV